MRGVVARGVVVGGAGSETSVAGGGGGRRCWFEGGGAGSFFLIGGSLTAAGTRSRASVAGQDEMLKEMGAFLFCCAILDENMDWNEKPFDLEHSLRD
jgi:hypothetical protein